MTRRLVKPEPDSAYPPVLDASDGKWYVDGGLWCRACPFGKVGDRLWCRETWATPPGCEDNPREAVYRADFAPGTEDNDGRTWRPSIHMRRSLSRLTLEITGVRVERLSLASDDDCIAEGIIPEKDTRPSVTFAKLWNQINEKRGFPWQSDPWVWVLTFRLVQS